MSLADRLKTRTETLHREAERSGIIHDLLRGRAGRPAYALLLRNLLPVYEAIEGALEGADAASALKPFARPELYRATALRSDLDQLAGPDWPETLPVLDSAQRYREHVAESAAGEGLRLISHVYVRYLGDLNGGQILGQLMRKHLGLGTEALAFYQFPDLSDPRIFAGAYRALFDQIDLPSNAVEPLLVEAMTAFRLNIEVSRDVARVGSETELCPI